MVELNNNVIANIQHNFGIDEPIIRNLLKHKVKVVIGHSIPKYKVFDNVVGINDNAGELRIGYFTTLNRQSTFRIYSFYPYLYKPDYMIMAGKTFKTDSDDKISIAIKYLEMILSIEGLGEND